MRSWFLFLVSSWTISKIIKSIHCFLRCSSIRASSSFSFSSSLALISLFFSFIWLISCLFCRFFVLLSFYFSYYSLMAASALRRRSSPSSISSLILLMYCFLTSLCCFRMAFSNCRFFSFSAYFLRLSSSYWCLIWF